jgi:Tol biopolymer transport system component
LAAHINDIAWHPSGQWFYFRRDQFIYKIDQHGKNEQQVFHLGANMSGLVFSDDGKQLLMSKHASDTDIWLQSIKYQNDTPASVLADSTRRDNRPRFANKSNQLAFLSDQSGSTQIWLRDNDNQVRQLSHFEFTLGLPSMAFSPDDKFLSFEYNDAIHRFEVATGVIEQILDTSHKAYVNTYSTDDKHLIYSSTKSGDWQLWTLELATMQSKQLTFNGGYSGWDNSVDGLLYFSKFHHDGLWRLNADGSETLIIEQFSILNWLNWRLIKNKVYYADKGKQGNGIYSYDLVTGDKKQVLKYKKDTLHDYAIAADGSAIAFTRHISQSADVMVLQITP